MTGLRLAAVGHRFGPTQVLAGIDLELTPESVLSLVGPSGCGKTTLLRLVAGLLTPAEGRIDNGFRCVVPVFQQPRLLPWATAAANIALGLKARGVARARRLATAAALGAQLGLTADDLAKFPHALSGGMQSRVALARAFALDPDLLLLDEPFTALDIGLKHELYGLLLEQVARRCAAVLLITHDLMEAVRLSDRVLMMGAQPGRILRAFDLPAARAARDDAWVYRTTADLMQAREVRLGFGLAASRSSVTALRTGMTLSRRPETWKSCPFPSPPPLCGPAAHPALRAGPPLRGVLRPTGWSRTAGEGGFESRCATSTLTGR